MKKVKQFLANNTVARVTCVVLAVALVFGALGAFSSIFHRDKIKEGVQYPADHINVEAYGQRSSDYAVLYDQEGLVACYVAYGSDSITEKGDNTFAWKNYVAGGKDATLYGANYWRRYNGGIGYTMSIVEWTNDREKVGCIVPYTLSTDENDEYTVETVLSYTGLTNSDGSLYYASSDEYPHGVRNMRKSAFRFGLLHSLGFVASSDTVTNQSFSNRWFLSAKTPYDGYNADSYFYELGQDYFAAENRGKISLMTVSRTYNDEAWHYNTKLAYGRHANASVLSHLISPTFHWGMEQGIEEERFSLLNGFPGSLYAIRYYDHVISQDTRLRNFFVDLCGFYDVNVSNFFKLSTDELEAFLVSCGTAAHSLNVEMDAKNVSANRAKVYEIINNNLKG